MRHIALFALLFIAACTPSDEPHPNQEVLQWALHKQLDHLHWQPHVFDNLEPNRNYADSFRQSLQYVEYVINGESLTDSQKAYIIGLLNSPVAFLEQSPVQYSQISSTDSLFIGSAAQVARQLLQAHDVGTMYAYDPIDFNSIELRKGSPVKYIVAKGDTTRFEVANYFYDWRKKLLPFETSTAKLTPIDDGYKGMFEITLPDDYAEPKFAIRFHTYDIITRDTVGFSKITFRVE